MYGAIFGFNLLVWWPKCTPASRSCFIDTTAIDFSSWIWLKWNFLHGWTSRTRERTGGTAAPCVYLCILFRTLTEILYHNGRFFSTSAAEFISTNFRIICRASLANLTVPDRIRVLYPRRWPQYRTILCRCPLLCRKARRTALFRKRWAGRS